MLTNILTDKELAISIVDNKGEEPELTLDNLRHKCL